MIELTPAHACLPGCIINVISTDGISDLGAAGGQGAYGSHCREVSETANYQVKGRLQPGPCCWLADPRSGPSNPSAGDPAVTSLSSPHEKKNRVQ